MKFKLVEAVSDFNNMKKSLSKYEGILPFRYDSEYSSYIDQLYAKAVNNLEKKFSKLFIEPSIQLGSGSIIATFNYNGEECGAEWDYGEESRKIDDLIINSKSEAEFIKDLAKYIETKLLDDCAEDLSSSDIAIIPANEARSGFLSSRTAAKFSKAKHIKVEEGITEIDSNCFNSFKNLESIDLPDTIERIGYYAFAHCKKLTSIRIPDSVTSVGMGVFYDCEKLRDVIIGEGITELSDKWYFRWCFNLKAIMIPDSVTSMNDEMFDSCPDIIIYCNPNSYAHQYAIKHNLATRFYEDVVNDAESRIPESASDESLNEASYADNFGLVAQITDPRYNSHRYITTDFKLTANPDSAKKFANYRPDVEEFIERFFDIVDLPEGIDYTSDVLTVAEARKQYEEDKRKANNPAKKLSDNIIRVKADNGKVYEYSRIPIQIHKQLKKKGFVRDYLGYFTYELDSGYKIYYRETGNRSWAEIMMINPEGNYIRETRKVCTTIEEINQCIETYIADYSIHPETITEASESKICCICKKPFDGYGNNAEPVCSGSCCDECNMKEVIPARMKLVNNSPSKDLDEAKVDDILPGQISIFDNFRKFVELPYFQRCWKAEGLTEEDLRDLQNQILNNPETAVDLGDQVYKIRFAPKSMNKGKSGAYRVFYIDIIMQETIYLVGLLDKADAENISRDEVNQLRKLSATIKGDR